MGWLDDILQQVPILLPAGAAFVGGFAGTGAATALVKILGTWLGRRQEVSRVAELFADNLDAYARDCANSITWNRSQGLDSNDIRLHVKAVPPDTMSFNDGAQLGMLRSEARQLIRGFWRDAIAFERDLKERQYPLPLPSMYAKVFNEGVLPLARQALETSDRVRSIHKVERPRQRGDAIAKVRRDLDKAD